jgi:hypothetical protein
MWCFGYRRINALYLDGLYLRSHCYDRMKTDDLGLILTSHPAWSRRGAIGRLSCFFDHFRGATSVLIRILFMRECNT